MMAASMPKKGMLTRANSTAVAPDEADRKRWRRPQIARDRARCRIKAAVKPREEEGWGASHC
ncbi:hypothetical protein GCM10007884_30010 [Methylobacterium brachythecii]|uniref:Uncharacterized protein n=1 Tax=Methylobacterium brachythecii TaxID=1176177 RepID=A0ABQ6D3U0_9HYPH|nr:hypothetical protein GCM10007884_30010 [Methylobacterium brachythecii]